MTDIIVNSFLGACGAGILTILVLLIKWIWKKIHADTLAIRALMHNAFSQNCQELLLRDELTEDDLENHDLLWQAYKAQGLNGTGAKLHDEILHKKIIANK